ncbi:hypothetical protein DB88DRAFT_482279 [Papiliotrema laurentii]|uniref:Uncharacterized protein n=1 Tax=Papiliotrema laurentii TaxID=5418 RepID=A0AAD9FUT7_PAPLA|nr:hypothetical protein DB88DRAFT_482279 [Papiliotrema laurentii]
MPPVQTRLPTTSSSPSSPFAHPRSSMSPVSSPASSMRPPPAPYMVALSGWPEPVYISNRSRPSTPRPMFPGEVSDGIPNLPLSPPTHKPIHQSPIQTHAYSKADKEGVGGLTQGEMKSPPLPSSSRHPSHVHSHPHQLAKDNHPFPTSSTRTPTHSPPPPSAPYPYAGMTLNRHSTFRDPRLAPGVAVVHNKPLTVAPNWTHSSSPPPPASPYSPLGNVTNVGMKVPAGERGTGILVMRAVPDVYPPPAPPGMAGMAASMASMTKGTGPTPNGRHVGVATEVYPRDPDSAFLWGGAAGVPREPSVGTDEDMDADNQREW